MNTSFEKAYKQLNDAQRKAVDQIDGPLLVVAGPGTGKTQLLSTRVGSILKLTDALPESILCLTFTESGALAMRQRLNRLIGEAAYDVQISTYHAFGSELIRRYPEYVSNSGLEPIDDVGMNSVVREILAELSYSNPYKPADTYASDLLNFIGEAKRALLTPELLMRIAADNQKFIELASKITKPLFNDFKRMDKKSLPLFEMLRGELERLTVDMSPVRTIETLASECHRELTDALELASETGKTTSVTKWKNKWLARNANAQMIIAGGRINERLLASTEVYRKYLDKLSDRGLFDYDDMILRAIDSLENNIDFKLTLAERYQFIMLDEFQDTNPSQLKLIELLADSPINEGRPNIMAVGDDDQAIYAFQGANYSNMLSFLSLYRDVEVVTLTNNYRSHQDILHIAHGLAESIETRLHSQLKGTQKVLEAAGKRLPPKAIIARHEFVTEADENSWVARSISKLIKSGIAADQIAILAPKHKYLQTLLPFLATHQLPVWYEKREDVLDEPHVRMIEQMSRLCLALQNRDYGLSDALWVEVLSYEFWQLPTDKIWEVSWQAYKNHEPWTSLLLDSDLTKPIVEYFLDVASKLHITTLEQQLDSLIGVENDDSPLPSSLFYDFYFGSTQPADYMSLLSNLTVLRERLRRYRRDSEHPLSLGDYITFVDAHRTAKLPIINTSPYHANESSIQMMTTYKAKGLEFDVVFIVAATDEVWGSASRSRSSNISLPANLLPIRYSGADDDERRRLLYVAATRAKSQLIMTSYAQGFDGKLTSRLKYMEGGGIEVTEQLASKAKVAEANLELYWGQRHLPPLKPSLASLLAPKLERYQLSATHINTFTDTEYGGPQTFFINTLLRFPKAPGPSGQYGNAIHETLEWANGVIAKDQATPTIQQLTTIFEKQMKAKRLSQMDTDLLIDRGKRALRIYWAARSSTFSSDDVHEYNFRNEGVLIGKAHLAGKIDKLVIDKQAKTITVVDFKTGKAHDRWEKSAKLHKYRQQLLMYKLLVEGSHTYRGYKVEKGVLEFIEPNEQGQISQLIISYQAEEVEKHKKLISAVWQHIQKLDFPDTSSYQNNLGGILSFEEDLLQN